MRTFKWIEWNRQKIAAHGLGSAEVEAAFDAVVSLTKRTDGSYIMHADLPSGKPVIIIWRFDRDADDLPDVFGELPEAPIFVITAY